MYTRKESSKNSYYPSFLCMEVDTPDYLDNLAVIPLDERTEAAFLHEYIHYLQDLTTVTGHARIETIVDQVKWAAEECSKHKNIYVPFDASSTYKFNMKPNYTSLNICKGDFKVKNVHGYYIAPKIQEVLSFQLENSSIDLPNGVKTHGDIDAVLLFKDENGNSHKYKVGELAISESMAYLIENMIYKNVLQKGNDCPYEVVRNITNWKLNQSVDDLVLIAICDVCLMYLFPGKVLYHLLEYLYTYKGKITPALIYIYGLGPSIPKLFNSKESWVQEFEKVSSTSRNQFRDYFNHPQWEHIMNAVFVSYDAAIKMRIDNPTFFLDIACGGIIPLNNAFKKVYSVVGCLSVKTSSDLIYNITPYNYSEDYIDADWFISLHQLYNILFTTDAIKISSYDGTRCIEKKCELKEWCHNSFTMKGEVDITETSSNCKYSPWLNVSTDTIKQCSFGRLWTVYGFNRVRLKLKN